MAPNLQVQIFSLEWDGTEKRLFPKHKKSANGLG